MSAVLDFDHDPQSRRWPHTESDHRIANSLAMTAALVRVQANAIGRGPALSPGSAQKLLEEVANRIETVAHLHRALALAPVDGVLEPAKYLRQICTMAQQTFDPTGRVNFEYDLAPGGALTSDRLGALGLMVNEAIINAVKYAHPSGVNGKLTVTCRPAFGDSLLVIVEDDGVGLPVNCDFDTGQGGGIGFRIIRALASQVGATVTCRSSPLGLTLQFCLKL